MIVSRIHKGCCDKETFSTQEAALLRLRQVTNMFETRMGQKVPRRAYECKRGNWHLTSMSLERWQLIEAYEKELEERRLANPPSPFPKSSPSLSPIARAAQEALERDGACIRCSGDQGVMVAQRGQCALTRRGITKAQWTQLRQTMLSNLITLCFQCDAHCRNRDQGWAGGWKLDAHMDPEQFPVLHHGIWVFLNNDGTITMAEEVGPLVGDAQEAFRAAE